MISEIHTYFAEKKLVTKLMFLILYYSYFMPKSDRLIDFKEKTTFSSENWQKLPNIAIITLTPRPLKEEGIQSVWAVSGVVFNLKICRQVGGRPRRQRRRQQRVQRRRRLRLFQPAVVVSVLAQGPHES
jgi:hypothetical protein